MTHRPMHDSKFEEGLCYVLGKIQFLNASTIKFPPMLMLMLVLVA